MKYLSWLLFPIGVLLLVVLLSYAMDRNDRVLCEKWARYEKEYPDFQISIKEKDYCRILGIEIND